MSFSTPATMRSMFPKKFRHRVDSYPIVAWFTVAVAIAVVIDGVALGSAAGDFVSVHRSTFVLGGILLGIVASTYIFDGPGDASTRSLNTVYAGVNSPSRYAEYPPVVSRAGYAKSDEGISRNRLSYELPERLAVDSRTENLFPLRRNGPPRSHRRASRLRVPSIYPRKKPRPGDKDLCRVVLLLVELNVAVATSHRLAGESESSRELRDASSIRQNEKNHPKFHTLLILHAVWSKDAPPAARAAFLALLREAIALIATHGEEPDRGPTRDGPADNAPQ
jgi:hypothetical protein